MGGANAVNSLFLGCGAVVGDVVWVGVSTVRIDVLPGLLLKERR